MDNDAFRKDPFKYASLASLDWAEQVALASPEQSLKVALDSSKLKDPVLWLSQTHALAEAAKAVLLTKPELKLVPIPVQGACGRQYAGVGLMLLGYSLEVCLKAMLIISRGISEYTQNEKNYKTHDLEQLAVLLPGLSAKDCAILRLLSFFVIWAGRYPDPGSRRAQELDEILSISSAQTISADDLFELVARIIGSVATSAPRNNEGDTAVRA